MASQNGRFIPEYSNMLLRKYSMLIYNYLPERHVEKTRGIVSALRRVINKYVDYSLIVQFYIQLKILLSI